MLAPKYCVTKTAIVKNIFFCAVTFRTPCIFKGSLVNRFLQRAELESRVFGFASTTLFHAQVKHNIIIHVQTSI